MTRRWSTRFAGRCSAPSFCCRSWLDRERPRPRSRRARVADRHHPRTSRSATSSAAPSGPTGAQGTRRRRSTGARRAAPPRSRASWRRSTRPGSSATGGRTFTAAGPARSRPAFPDPRPRAPPATSRTRDRRSWRRTSARASTCCSGAAARSSSSTPPPGGSSIRGHRRVTPRCSGRAAFRPRSGGETLLGSRRAAGWALSVQLRCLLQPRRAGADRCQATASSWSTLAGPAFHGELALADPAKSSPAARRWRRWSRSRWPTRASAPRNAASATARRWTPSRSRRLERGDGACSAGWARTPVTSRTRRPRSRWTSPATRPPGCASTTTGDSRPRPRPQAGCGWVGSSTRAARRRSIPTDWVLRGRASRPRDRVHRLRAVRRRARAVELRRGAPGGPERYALRRLRSSRTCTIPRSRNRADPTRTVRGGARLRLPPRLDRPDLRRPAFVVRAMCVDPERSCSQAFGTLWRTASPGGARAVDDVCGRLRDVAGPLRAALHRPIRRTRRAGEFGWSRASARTGA